MRVELRILDKDLSVKKSIRDTAIKQFQKLERYVPEATHIDLRLERIKSHRKGNTRYAHVAVAIPKEAKTFHTEAITDDFRTALDRIYDKTEKHLRRRHDKLTRRRRDAERKGEVNSWLHNTLSAPKRLLRRDPESVESSK